MMSFRCLFSRPDYATIKLSLLFKNMVFIQINLSLCVETYTCLLLEKNRGVPRQVTCTCSVK